MSRDSLLPHPPPWKLPGGSSRSDLGSAALTPHPGEERRAEVALVWPEPLGGFVRRGEGVMSSRLGAVPAVSFSVWPLCLRGSAVEPATRARSLAFVPCSELVLSEPIVGPTLLGQICLPFFPPLNADCCPPPWTQFLARLPLISVPFIFPVPPISVSSLFASL